MPHRLKIVLRFKLKADRFKKMPNNVFFANAIEKGQKWRTCQTAFSHGKPRKPNSKNLVKMPTCQPCTSHWSLCLP